MVYRRKQSKTPSLLYIVVMAMHLKLVTFHSIFDHIAVSINVNLSQSADLRTQFSM